MGIIDMLRDSRDTETVYSRESVAVCPCGKGEITLHQFSKFEDFPALGTAQYVGIICPRCEKKYDIRFDEMRPVLIARRGTKRFTPEFHLTQENNNVEII